MSSSTLLSRLLALYPVNVLRTTWPLGNLTKDEAIAKIVKTQTQQAIVRFAAENFPCTRQHVYLFELSAPFNDAFPPNPLGWDTEVIRFSTAARHTFFYLLDLKFNVILLDALESQSIEFKWPVTVVVEEATMQVKFTIMEKDLRTYFPNSGAVTVRNRSINENDILRAIRDNLKPTWQAEPMDINKGVKALWKQNFIDSPEARWRNSKSTSRETMDEKFMIRRDRPEVYQAAMKSPLLKTQFLFLKDGTQYVSHFVVEASIGLVRFPMFTVREDGTTNVLTKILELN